MQKGSTKYEINNEVKISKAQYCKLVQNISYTSVKSGGAGYTQAAAVTDYCRLY